MERLKPCLTNCMPEASQSLQMVRPFFSYIESTVIVTQAYSGDREDISPAAGLDLDLREGWTGGLSKIPNRRMESNLKSNKKKRSRSTNHGTYRNSQKYRVLETEPSEPWQVLMYIMYIYRYVYVDLSIYI